MIDGNGHAESAGDISTGQLSPQATEVLGGIMAGWEADAVRMQLSTRCLAAVHHLWKRFAQTGGRAAFIGVLTGITGRQTSLDGFPTVDPARMEELAPGLQVLATSIRSFTRDPDFYVFALAVLVWDLPTEEALDAFLSSV